MSNTSNSNNNNNSPRISNGTQACAACKYQRRKCAPDCVLAPYFPHDRQRQFLNAHKLFGVSNITKIIRNLNPPDKDIAMRTIMYQSDARAKDPVGGCYRIIRELHHQIEYHKAELELVLQQLAICKAQAYQQSQLIHVNPSVPSAAAPPQPLENVVEEQEGDVIQGVACGSNGYPQYQALMRFYCDNPEEDQTQYVGIQQQHQENENDQYSWTPHDDNMLASSNSSTSHGECFMVKRDFGGECDGQPVKLMRLDSGEVAPYEDERSVYGNKFDDPRHVDLSCGNIQREGLKFDPHQQTTEFSDQELSLKENKVILENQEDVSFHHHHHMPEHDLRTAATLFTLTN